MAWCHAPREWEDRIGWLADALLGRSRWRLGVLMLRALFASGRRVVASWIRAAAVIWTKSFNAAYRRKLRGGRNRTL